MVIDHRITLVLVLLAAALVCWPPLPVSVGRPTPPGRAGVSSSRRLRAALAIVTVALGGVLAFAGWPVALAVMVAAGTGWLLWRGRRRRARQTADLVDERTALAQLARELRAGADLHRAARELLDEATGAGARLLSVVLTDAETTLHVATPSLARRLVVLARLAGKHGVAVADVVDALVRDVDTRCRGMLDRREHTAGPRFSGYALAAMPILGLLIGTGMGADPVRVLTSGPPAGLLLPIGVALTCAGLLWVERIAG